jgi:hypothetical protein
MNIFSQVVKKFYVTWAIFVALICLSIHPSLSADIGNEICIDLSGESFADVTITTAEWHEINGGPICVVSAHRAPFLDMEVVLPSEWSGRYVQQGGGGFDGIIPSALQRNSEGEIVGLIDAVAKFNSVRAGSNGGNRAGVDGESAPGVWFADSAEAKQSLADYSYLALKTTLDFAHALTESVYGRLPDYGYFNGCSNGGRNAYIAAQRWPEAFDGIVSGCEPMNMPGTTSAWLSLAGVQGTAAELTSAEYTFAFNAAVSACDAEDGKADGIIGNPSACQFSPRELICEAGESFSCLSAEQADTLEMLLSDLVDSQGNIVSSGFYWADFSNFAPSFGGLGSVYGWIATGEMDWLQPEKQRQFNIDEHYYEIANGLLRSGVGHDRLAVAEFVASGKKLISWHDGSDNLLSPGDHVRIFNELSGAASFVANISDFNVGDHARFFVVPGTGHGGGAMTVNWIEAIIDWTENENAPQRLVHTRPNGDSIPVCRFPAYPQESGSGYTCSE